MSPDTFLAGLCAFAYIAFCLTYATHRPDAYARGRMAARRALLDLHRRERR